MKRVILLSFVCIVAYATAGLSGERAFSWTQAPARGDYVGVTLNPYNLGKYLAECEINRPEILNDVRLALKEGGYYRKSTTDQKDRAATVTVNVNPDYMLRIVTTRNDTCTNCNGTGQLDMPFGNFTRAVQIARRCRVCKGKGYLAGNTTEKYFVLSPEDFQNPREGRAVMSRRAYADAPDGAAEWVERLVSKNPRERLKACEWLDDNYVKVGTQFQDIMPMLKKARYQEANEKRRIMVWQFWAGKDLPDERKRAFYRIYVNTKSGKITEKGFFAAQ